MNLRQSDSREANRFSPPSFTNSEHSQSTQRKPPYEKTFYRLVEAIRHQLKPQPNIHFTVSLTGEDSQFTRFNQSKVRQTGQVRDGQLKLTLIDAATATDDDGTHTATVKRTLAITLPFVGNFTLDWASIEPAIASLQTELPCLPPDPYVVLPTVEGDGDRSSDQSREVHSGKLLSPHTLPETVLNPVQSLDFSGLYAGGLSYRAYADSAGKQHWFETPSFTLDYSLFGDNHNQAVSNQAASNQAANNQAASNQAANNQAVKGTLAGQQWQQSDYAQSIKVAQRQLELSSRPIKQLPRGCYRTYLAPAAVADIIDTIAWGGGLGEAALRQGNTAFSRLEAGEVTLSEQFSLEENFEQVRLPRFNSSGVIAPTRLPIIDRGRWVNSLINGRSAKEYGKASNGANPEEAMRAPAVAPGTLQESDILAALDTGLYVSNLHYLNWSDLNAGRITGMTRYACFWVEQGEIVAPIENLRFDDSLYRFLGEGLIGLSNQQTFVPAVGTYDQRSLGGMWVPGMLIEGFRYTL